MVSEEDEELSEPLKILREERIMLGSDMPHSESHPNSFLSERADLSTAIKRKILEDNARQFFAR